MVLIIVQQHPNCLEGYSSLCLQNFTSGKLIFLMQPTTPNNIDTAIDNLLHPRIQNPFTYDNVHFLTFVGFNAFTYVSAPGRYPLQSDSILCANSIKEHQKSSKTRLECG